MESEPPPDSETPPAPPEEPRNAEEWSRMVGHGYSILCTTLSRRWPESFDLADAPEEPKQIGELWGPILARTIELSPEVAAITMTIAIVMPRALSAWQEERNYETVDVDEDGRELDGPE